MARTYPCGICGAEFATLADRAEHIRSVHAKPEDPWE